MGDFLKKYFEVPGDRLATAAQFSFGVIVLVFFAFVLEGSPVLTHTGGLAAATVYGGTSNEISLTVNNTAISAGATTSISWTTLPGSVLGSTNTGPCFGDGAQCDVPYQTNVIPATILSNTPADIKAFTIGADPTPYIAVAMQNSTFSYIYKWTPSGAGCPVGGGFGDGVTCGTAFQNLSTAAAKFAEIATTSTDTYLLIANSASSTSAMYKWIPTLNGGKGCFAKDATSACGTEYQSFSTSGNNEWHVFWVAGTVYVISANTSSNDADIYKWTASGNYCPTGGGFGNGIVCANGSLGATSTTQGAYQHLDNAAHWVSWAHSVVSNVVYLTGAPATGYPLIYKWTASGTGCPVGGGFGTGAACNSNYSFVSVSSAGTYVKSSRIMSFTIGSDPIPYLFVSHSTLNNDWDIVFRWTASGTGCAASGGWGNGGGPYTPACDFSNLDWYQRLNIDNPQDAKFFLAADGKYYFVIPNAGEYTGEETNIWQWLPAGVGTWTLAPGWPNGCFGDDDISKKCHQVARGAYTDNTAAYKPLTSEAFTYNGVTYLILPNSAIGTNASIYKLMPAGGSRATCTVRATDFYNTYEVGHGDNGAVSSGPLSSDTSYLASCRMTDGTTKNTPSIPVSVSTSTVGMLSITASKPNAQESGTVPQSGSFDVTRDGGSMLMLATGINNLASGDLVVGGNNTYRILVDPSSIIAGGTGVRLTLQAGAAAGITIQNAYIAMDQNTDTNYIPNNGSTWTLVTFNNGAANITIPAGGTATTDIIPFAFRPDMQLIFSFYVPAGTHKAKYTVAGPYVGTYVISSGNVANSYSTALTWNPGSGIMLLKLVEAQQAGPLAEATAHLTLGGTATFGTHYGLSTGFLGNISSVVGNAFAITVPSNMYYQTIFVNPIDNAVIDGTRSVVGTVAADPSYVVGSPSNATVNILDDDGVSTPTITITSVINAAEPSTSGSFKFHINATQVSNLTINYTVSGSASATTSPDYTALSGTATILAGQTDSALIPVSVLDDATYEGTETVVIKTTASANYTGTPTATVTITDDESSVSLPPGAFTTCYGTASATCTLGISPSRVRKGAVNAATISWYVPGLVAGDHGNAGDSCQITSTPAVANFPQLSSSGATSWINTSGVQTTINQQTIFTLTCTAPDGLTKKSVSGTIGLIPSVLEI